MNELKQSFLFSSAVNIFEMRTEFFTEIYYEEFWKTLCSFLYKRIYIELHLNNNWQIFDKICKHKEIYSYLFYRCTVHFEDSLIITYQQML
jgi:hypothetical protein